MTEKSDRAYHDHEASRADMEGTTQTVQVVLERHEQHIKSLQHQLNDLKSVRHEIRRISDTLITLTAELQSANVHLLRQDDRIKELESARKTKLTQISGAIINTLISGLAGYLAATLMSGRI